MKKLNYYYGMDVCLAFFLILMFCKNAKYSWYVGTVVIGAVLLVLAYFSKTKVTNKSDRLIKAKPENTAKPLIDVLPGTEHYGLDGIKAKPRQKVFKARNGTHIVVNTDGSITTKSITGTMANSFLTGAGYRSKDQLPSDWDPLFDSEV